MLIGLALLAAAYVVGMIWIHPRLIYPFYDTAFTADHFERVEVSLPDAEPLPIYVHRSTPRAPVVLYFMGNVGALELFRPMLEHHAEAGRNVVAMAYRGGGGIPGTSSETSLKRDALAAADKAAALFPQAPLFVQGYSLGTGLAVHVAARRDVAGVVLSAPYDALCRLMAKRSGLPACFLPVQRWRTDRDVPQLRAPVLIQHGTADKVVPFVYGARLSGIMEQAGVEVAFHPLNGAGHNNLMQFPTHQSQIDAFINARR